MAAFPGAPAEVLAADGRSARRRPGAGGPKIAGENPWRPDPPSHGKFWVRHFFLKAFHCDMDSNLT